MTNEFYTLPTANVPLTTIRSADENSDRIAVSAAFDKLPTEADLKRSVWGTDASTIATLYEISVPYWSGEPVVGQEVTFEAALTNTGAASVKFNSGGIYDIKDIFNASLVANTINAGQLITMVYTSTGVFRLANATSDAGAASASAEVSAIDAAASAAAALASEAAAAAFFEVVPHTGGGTLVGMRVNEIRDGNTYTLPAVNSLAANQWLVIELPDTNEASIPTVLAAGGDLISVNGGTDGTIIFNSGSTWMRLVSDGSGTWRL